MKDNTMIVITIVMIVLAIFALGLLTGESNASRTKYEYYTKDGERGTTYKCEVKEKVQCEIDGNMIEVAQFSEAE